MVAGVDQLRAAIVGYSRRVSFALAFTFFACTGAKDTPINATGSAGSAAAAAALPATGPASKEIRRFQSPEEALAAFRVGLIAPDTLRGASPTRDALIARFVRAVEHADTAEISAMVIDRAEFAYLYYPTSPYTQPPTVQEAPLTWFLLVENSQVGITRVFNRMAGRMDRYVGHRCEALPSVEGSNRFWRGCRIELRTGTTGVETKRLFGSIIEREGRFKFFSYANDF
jgi:hypothetical protein